MTPWEMSSANLTQHIPSATGCFDFVLILLAAVFQLETGVRTGLLALHHICGKIEAVWQTRPPDVCSSWWCMEQKPAT